MKRFTLSLVLAGLLLAPGTSLAAATAKPRAGLSSVCSSSPVTASRKLSATATMRTFPGTRRFAVKFVLQSRAPGGGYRGLEDPPLGLWVQSPTSLKLLQKPKTVWHIEQTVVGLQAGTTYRLRVSFRWYAAGATVLRHRTLYTQGCPAPPVTPAST